MPDNSKRVVAPYIANLAGSEDKKHSFATYFLRDLHQQGKLNEDVIRQVASEHATSHSAEEILEAIKNHSGESVSESLAADMTIVASIGSQRN